MKKTILIYLTLCLSAELFSQEPSDSLTKVETLQDVIVTGQTAVSRKTPVAASTLYMPEIQEKIGNRELPELLKGTPSVYVSRQGGGWGDSEVYMRGFDNTNIAILVNGIPMNDMLDVTCYWSNWAALGDIAGVLQAQRGIGAAKLSSPSVGGTINIQTRGIDSNPGGFVQGGVGNDGYNKLLFSVSSGLHNGWAFTLMGGRSSGNGYIQGLDFEVWSYYVNISKRINASHQLTLVGFGAPQKHNMRSYALTKVEWDKVSQNYSVPGHWSRYNPEYGFDRNGQRKTQDFNQYHKPQISLNHTWSIDEKSNLSTTAYVSLGRGYGIYGTADEVDYSEYDWYPSDNGILNMEFRCPDGTFDYAKIQEINSGSSTGSKLVLNKQHGEHNWYGLVSTYTDKVLGCLDIQGGVDLKYYHGMHHTNIWDLLDGEYYIDPTRSEVKPANNAAASDPSWVGARLGVGDVVCRNYDSHIMQEGLFAQLEYSKDKITAFVSGALNYSTYWKEDHLYYDEEHSRSGNAGFLGGNGKAGMNFNIDSHNNIYTNVGFTSKAPVFKGGVFMSATSSNVINTQAKNEKSATAEIGYGFHNGFLNVNFCGYFTEWMDKSMRKKGKLVEQYYINMTGVNSRHMGLELDVKARPARWVELYAMASVGDWRWDSDDVTGYAYNLEGQAITADGTVTTPGAADHAWAKINMKGIHVGGSAQTTASIEAMFIPFKGMRIGGGYTFYDRNYAYYSLSGSSLSLGKELYVTEPWRVPCSGTLDLRASYQFDIARKFRTTLSAVVNNVLDNYYIEKAWNPSIVSQTPKEVNPEDVYFFYSLGRTWSVNLKFEF